MAAAERQGRVVGRERELACGQALVAASARGPAALVLAGAAGIGKTTVWRAVAASARADGSHVLAARPTEAEARLSYAAIGDLLADVPGDGLPPPQEHALEVALRRRDPGTTPIDLHAVAAAVRTLLLRLAADRPVLVAVDDVQWLDGASARVLEFVVRRLGDARVGVLVGVRSPARPALLAALADGVPDMVELSIAPLPRSALDDVLALHVPGPLAGPTTTRIWRASAGNPLYAIALGRAAAAGALSATPGTPVPIPASLEAAITARIAALPRRTRRVLVAAALATAPSLDMLGEATPGAAPALGPALAAGIVELRDGAVGFTHPLLAEAAAATATPAERRATHRRLAAVATDPEAHARHLALASERPSEPTSAALESAARLARGRGAVDAAAELAALAVRRTPARAASLDRRRLLLGECLALAGDGAAARAALEPLFAPTVARELRVPALLLAGRIAFAATTSVEAATLAEQALAAAGDDDLLAAQVHANLYLKHDVPGALAHAERALALLTRHPAPPRAAVARARLAVIDARVNAGDPLVRTELDAALALVDDDHLRPVAHGARYAAATALWPHDHVDDARVLLEALLVEAEQAGDVGSLPAVLHHLAFLESLAGRWATARAHGERGLAEARATGQEMRRASSVHLFGELAVQEGRLDEAARLLAEAAAIHARLDDPIEPLWTLRTVGLLELCRGDAIAAVAALDEVEEISVRTGMRCPGMTRHAGDRVTALVALGDLERAGDALAAGRAVAERAGIPSTLADVARGEAVLHAARGALDESLDAAARAVAIGRTAPVPFELGRALLVQAQVHRRRREKRLAAEALDAAETILADLGAAHVLAEVRAERRRLGLRASDARALTPTEARVAELAAAGRSNPEIARALFVSRKTVEFTLGKVYRKLGVRGRGELAARLGGAVPPSP